MDTTQTATAAPTKLATDVVTGDRVVTPGGRGTVTVAVSYGNGFTWISVVHCLGMSSAMTVADDAQVPTWS